MASPSTPQHGKDAAIWRHRPNGFVGQGLNDATWTLSGYSGANSTYLEVEIDGTGAPDTFQWRADGGAWTTDVNITGAAQTIADGITITFAATTGHTLADKWSVGYLDGEGCTESSDEAQITTAGSRILNPNNLATFTDSGGETAIEVHPTKGWAKFTGNVTVVTVDGEYVPSVALELMGYLISWDWAATRDMADLSRCQQDAKEVLPGQLGFTGSAMGHLIVCDTFFDDIIDAAAGTQKLHLLKLFNYEPDGDQIGDHWICWATLSGFDINSPLGETVKESINFAGDLIPEHVADS